MRYYFKKTIVLKDLLNIDGGREIFLKGPCFKVNPASRDSRPKVDKKVAMKKVNNQSRETFDYNVRTVQYSSVKLWEVKL